MHALFLATRVDRHDPGVNDDDDPHDEVVLLEDDVGHERDEVESLVLVAVQLDDYHE